MPPLQNLFFAEVDGEKFVELTSLAKRVQKKRGDKALVSVWHRLGHDFLISDIDGVRARGALTCSHVRTVRMLHIPAHMCSTTNTNTNAHTRTLTCCSDISTLRPQFPHASPCVSVGACVRGRRRGCRFHFFVRSMSGTYS